MYGFNHDEAIRSFRRAAELDPELRDGVLGRRRRERPAHQQPGAAAPTAPRPRGRRSRGRRRAARDATPGREGADRGARRALRLAAARGPQAAGAGLRRRHARGLGRLPEGPRRRRALRGGAGGPAAVGPVAARRQAAARDGGARRDARAVLALDPKHPLAQPPVHPRRRGLAAARAGRRAPPTRCATACPGSATWSTCPRTSTCGAGAGRRRSTPTPRRSRPTARYTARSPEQGFYRLYMAHNHHMLTYAAMMTGQSALALQTIREMVGGHPARVLPRQRVRRRLHGDAARGADALRPLGRDPGRAGVPRLRADLARAPALRARRRVRREGRRAGRRAGAAGVPRGAHEGAEGGLLRQQQRPRTCSTWPRAACAARSLPRPGSATRASRCCARPRPARTSCATTSRPTGSSRCATRSARRCSRPGRFAEAEAVFREDLAKLPDNGWGLYGLSRALQLQKKTGRGGGGAEALRRGLEPGRRQDPVGLPVPAGGVISRDAGSGSPSRMQAEKSARAPQSFIRSVTSLRARSSPSGSRVSRAPRS